ncbi:MAG: helix-turn-helix domain-containing protein [Acidobacteria bacterium]|nr:helix-turn-helix domain-containing protein [Acidobacteriota bacterium]
MKPHQDELTQEPSARATLAQLLENLGEGLVTILAAPKGLDVEVVGPAIFDPLAGSPVEPGDLILAVATDLSRAGDIVLAAADAGAAGVAFKLPGDPPPALAEAGARAGIAILAVPHELSWGHFFSLLRTAVASTAQVPTQTSDVPVGDLFALANAVAAMVGGPVTIEDPSFRILAYSSLEEPVDELRMQTILGRRSPAAWMSRFGDAGFLRRVATTDDVVTVAGIPEEGVLPRIAIAVRAGGEMLGSIWVIVRQAPAPPASAEALREASRIAALHLMRHRATADIERRFRGDLLLSLIEGRGPIEAVATKLGVDADGAFTVVAFELHSAEEPELSIQRERTLELIAVYCEAFRRRSACVASGKTVYCLLPTAPHTGRPRLIALAADIIRRAERSLTVGLHAGIGSTVSPLRNVPRSRWEADQVVRVVTRSPERGPVAHIEDVRAHTLLLELQDLAADRPHFAAGKLELLRRADAQQGTDYLRTLSAYFEHQGNVARAAQALGIHANTLRYRLRRMVELSGLDLDDADERLIADLQLRFL